MAARKVSVVFLFLLIGTLELAAQPGVSSGMTHYAKVQVFRLKAWTRMTGNQWRDIIYRFSEFQDGRITLREGYSPEHPLKLNYNIHLDRVEFLSEEGDTNVFNNSSQIKSITIGTQFFYNDYPSGYIEKINQTTVALGAKHHLKMMFESNNGELFNATDWNLPTTRLDRLYVRQDEFFFIDEQETIYKATLPSILKIYSSHRNEVKRYVKKNNIDFKNKEDLLRLLNFCQLLSSRQMRFISSEKII